MDRGRVVETGSHDELMATQGAYWRLHEAQQRQAQTRPHAGGLSMTFSLERNPHGHLVLTLPDGTRHEGVTPVRAFPLSDADGPFSLVGADGKRTCLGGQAGGLATLLWSRWYARS